MPYAILRFQKRKAGGHFLTGSKSGNIHTRKYSKTHEQRKEHRKGSFQCFHQATSLKLGTKKGTPFYRCASLL